MATKKILYIQFYQGELGRIEQRAVRRTVGDIANLTFINPETLNEKRFDLAHDFDGLIIGPAPIESKLTILSELIKFARQIDFPTLGIGYGHLLLAQEFGLQLKTHEQINITKRYFVRNSQAAISPSDESFFAYVNMAESVVAENNQTLFASEEGECAGVEYSEKIFGVEFLPFLDNVTSYWWLRPYPDFWLNLTGFWYYTWAREQRLFSKIFDYITRKLFTDEEWQHELQLRAEVAAKQRDFAVVRSILRRFIGISK